MLLHACCLVQETMDRLGLAMENLQGATPADLAAAMRQGMLALQQEICEWDNAADTFHSHMKDYKRDHERLVTELRKVSLRLGDQDSRWSAMEDSVLGCLGVEQRFNAAVDAAVHRMMWGMDGVAAERETRHWGVEQRFNAAVDKAVHRMMWELDKHAGERETRQEYKLKKKVGQLKELWVTVQLVLEKANQVQIKATTNLDKVEALVWRAATERREMQD